MSSSSLLSRVALFALNQSLIKEILLTCSRSLQFVTITDGEPTGPGERMETTRNVIARAKDYLSTLPYGAGSVAFMFAQVLIAHCNSSPHFWLFTLHILNFLIKTQKDATKQ